MCGRYAIGTSSEDILNETGLSPPADWTPHYNVAPGQRILVERLDATGRRELAMLWWGLCPHWTKDASIAHKLINARAETLDERPAFRDAFHQHRCLVRASGFFEWDHSSHKKRPVYFRFREPKLALGGIGDRWQRRGVAPHESVAIVTTEANDAIARIHDRMPLILDAAAQAAWLDPHSDITTGKTLLKPLDPRLLEPIRVSEEANSPKNDYPSLLEPVGT